MLMMGDNKKSLFSLIFISICIIFASGIHKTPTLTGDAREYILMSQAFIGHGTPDLRKSDVDGVVVKPGNSEISEYFPPEILSWSPPFYSAKSGGVYSYHFWLFSLIFTPFVLLARLMGFADTSGYLFGNIFFVCLTAFYFFRSKAYGLMQSYVGIVLFFSIGGISYLRWQHPEIFSASLLCVGLILLREGRVKTSALFMAIAGQQNPPIILLLPFLFIFDATWIARKKCGIYTSIRRLYPWVFIATTSVLSALFYKIEFGVFNLIASVGYADSSLISMNRLSSLFFDPNFGIFWNMPFAFIAGVGVLMFRVGSNIEWKWVSIFIFISIICAVPSLSATNWNSGMTAISRYGFWCAVPLIFAFLEVFKCMGRKRVKYFVFLVVVFFQVGLIVFNGGAFGRRDSYIEFHPFAKFFMNKMPRMYSPIPEVFIERGNRQELVDDKKIYYWVNSGRVDKLLFNMNSVEDSLLPHVCDDDSPWRRISSVDVASQGWVYWNMMPGCFNDLPDGFHAVISAPSVKSGQDLFPSDDNLFKYGWRYNEVEHRWSLGEISVLHFYVQDLVRFVTLCGNFMGTQNFEILLNGEIYGMEAGSYTAWEVDSCFSVDLSVAPTPKNGVFTLTFRWLGANERIERENEVLSFALRKINFN